MKRDLFDMQVDARVRTAATRWREDHQEGHMTEDEHMKQLEALKRYRSAGVLGNAHHRPDDGRPRAGNQRFELHPRLRPADRP